VIGGNKLFKIYDGRDRFYQWDVDRKLVIEDATITQVHFCNRTDECSLVCETYQENGLTLVNVPNVLLQSDWRINVYAYDTNYTKFSETYKVERRSKPENYVYTETEVLNYNTLLDRIDEVELEIPEAVNEYMKDNPPSVDLSGYVTEEELSTALDEIELTPGPAGKDGKDGAPGKDGKDYVLTDADKEEIAGMVDVSGGDVDLSDYYTKTEIDNLLANLPAGDIPSGEEVGF
jgi:hypothetical protein